MLQNYDVNVVLFILCMPLVGTVALCNINKIILNSHNLFYPFREIQEIDQCFVFLDFKHFQKSCGSQPLSQFDHNSTLIGW